MKKDKINLKDIPKEIPIFPLSNAIFFPNTVLPLNIFEPRYKQMTEDALKNSKLIGMAQPNLQTIDPIKPRIFEVGCLGKVENYSETKDGRYLISLKGVTRFKVVKKLITTSYIEPLRSLMKIFLMMWNKKKVQLIKKIY